MKSRWRTKPRPAPPTSEAAAVVAALHAAGLDAHAEGSLVHVPGHGAMSVSLAAHLCEVAAADRDALSRRRG